MAPTRSPRGFSLIEQLVAMSAVGGAMALTLPQAAQLHEAAQASTLASLAGAAQSAMALNQAACALAAGATPPEQTLPSPVQRGKNCQPLRQCVQVSSLLLFDLAGHYRLDDAPGPAQPGELACTLTQTATGLSRRFTGPAT